jgi:hypothetical protein
MLAAHFGHSRKSNWSIIAHFEIRGWACCSSFHKEELVLYRSFSSEELSQTLLTNKKQGSLYTTLLKLLSLRKKSHSILYIESILFPLFLICIRKSVWEARLLNLIKFLGNILLTAHECIVYADLENGTFCMDFFSQFTFRSKVSVSNSQKTSFFL